jgi:hypothetical protein
LFCAVLDWGVAREGARVLKAHGFLSELLGGYEAKKDEAKKDGAKKDEAEAGEGGAGGDFGIFCSDTPRNKVREAHARQGSCRQGSCRQGSCPGAG